MAYIICLVCIIVAIIVMLGKGSLIAHKSPAQYSPVLQVPVQHAGVVGHPYKPLRDPERLARVNQEWKKMPVDTPRSSRIKWRDEETSADLTTVLVIPNRYTGNTDIHNTPVDELPDVSHLRPVYNPDPAKLKRLASSMDSGLSDLTRDNKAVPSVDMIPQRLVHT